MSAIDIIAKKLPTKLNREWAVEIVDALDAAGYVIVPKAPSRYLHSPAEVLEGWVNE